MRVLVLLSLFFIASQSFAVGIEQLGMKLDPAKDKAPNLDVKKHEIVGLCDGDQYTNAAELEGCQKNVSKRMLGPGAGYPKMPMAPMAAPDQKQ